MTTIILIAIAVGFVLAIAEVLREVLQDRAGTPEPPRSHYDDQRFAPPSSWAA